MPYTVSGSSTGRASPYATTTELASAVSDIASTDLAPLRFTDSPIKVMAAPPTLTWYNGAVPLSPATAIAYDSTTAVTHEGCVTQLNATYSFLDNAVNDDLPSGWRVTFDYYGADFCVNFRSFDTIGGTYQLYVDGEQITASPFNPSGFSVSVGSGLGVRVTFTTAALRRISLFISNAQYKGIYIGKSDSITPAPANPVRAVAYGDSFVATSGTPNLAEQLLWPATLSRLFGWTVANCGQGGTGYGKDGSGSYVRYDNTSRVQSAAAYDPRYVIIFGSINNDADTSVVAAGAESCFSKWATYAPDAQLIVVGPPPNDTTVPAGRTTNKGLIRTAALGASNVLAWIDPIAGTWETADGLSGGNGAQWISGTGYVGATASDGNADVFIGTDNVHPSVNGHHYLAHRIGADILNILKAKADA